jgi:hypothetical protein
MTTRNWWLGALRFVAALAVALLVGCGRGADGEVVTGQLRAGGHDYWLVDTTLVAIGGAQINGERSQIGSTVRVEGRRQADGVFAATRVTVGAVSAGASAASLPTATASGVIVAIDPATGRWQVAGRQVQLAPGVNVPGGIAVGDRATAKGYELPDGVLLAAEIAPERAAPTVSPAGTAPTPTAAPIRVEARLSDQTPPRSAQLTVTGALLRGDTGIPGVPMHTVWHFRSGDSTCEGGVTGSDGRAACTLRVSNATPRHAVVVEVIFEYEGRTYRSEVSFTPR